MAGELLFADLIREGREAMRLSAERERLSTLSGRLLALKQEMPAMMVNFEEAKSCVQRYYVRREADQIAALVASQKL